MEASFLSTYAPQPGSGIAPYPIIFQPPVVHMYDTRAPELHDGS